MGAAGSHGSFLWSWSSLVFLMKYTEIAKPGLKDGDQSFSAQRALMPGCWFLFMRHSLWKKALALPLHMASRTDVWGSGKIMQAFFKQEQRSIFPLWGMWSVDHPTWGTFHSQGNEEGPHPCAWAGRDTASVLKALDRVSVKHEELGWECHSQELQWRWT